MNEMISMILDEMKSSMEKALHHAEAEFLKIRAGKAMPSMLDGVMAEAYGMNMPLNQLATVNTPDARTLVIQPFDKSSIQAIEKGIMEANLGFTPQNDGTIIRINVPPLTEERRKNLVKNVKSEAENAKITIRNIRKDSNEEIRKLKSEGVSEDEMKDAEAKVQQFTDQYVARIDVIAANKEKEIMTV